MGQIVLARLD